MVANWIIASLFLGTLASAAQLPGKDADFSCIEKSQAEELVRLFNINVTSFGGLELCKADVDTKKLFNDLILVRDGTFAGTDKNLFIRGFVDARNYFNWLQDMTRGIRRGHDIPYATAYNRGGYFTMQDGWAQLSTLGRVGTLIHEARHTGGYYHVWCDQGPYEGGGVSGCDESLPEGGSHGVEMEYYSRVVLQGTNFHPVYKQMARLMNIGRANFVFNDKPLVAESALVALSKEDIYVVSPEFSRTIPIPFHESFEFELKRTSTGAAMYSGQIAYSLDFYGDDQPAEGLVDEFSYYKLLNDGRLPGVVDMEELDIGVRRYLVALTDSNQLHTYQFSSGRWSNGVAVSGVHALITTAPNGQDGLFLLLNDGKVRPVNPQNLQIGAPLPQLWPADAVGFAKWNNRLLLLNVEGQVLDAEKRTPFDGFSNIPLRQMLVAPVYDAFAL